ncbi:hypothetical protein [Streptomyces sp. NRRL F-5727]|uniref:hypothetical protein n=1 Tax=Streptomyces sp. NRRL F-5727 TaxID=1463871 RepID=UPI00131B759F|nr:hypothetical protein [Streptomyces sp. NRRL F-5727]
MGLLSWLRGGRGAERPAGPPAPAAREDRFDVAELPPIQRTLGAPALVTDPSAFERGLPTRQPTALSTPLGHLISAEAPGGLVRGVTKPVQRSVSVVEFPVRDGVRPAESVPLAGSPVPELPGVRPPATAPSAAPVQRAASLPVPGRPGPDPAPGATHAPDRRENPEIREIQRAPEGPTGPTGPTESVASRGAAEVETRAPDVPPFSPAPTDGADVEPSVRPLVGERPLLDTAPEPDAAPETAAPPVQRSLPPTGAPRPSRPSPAPSPPPRRSPGLGAPLPALPPTAQREAPGAAPAVPAPVPAAAPTRVRTDSAALPPLPAPTPAPAPEPVAQLLADRPLVLRSVSSEPAPSATAPAAAAAVPVRWEAPAVPRQTSHLSSRPTPALVQRATARPVPTPPRPPQPPQPPRDAGDVAVAAGVAQRMADGSVVFGTPPPPPPVVHHRPATPSAALFVQREVAAEEPPPPPPEDVEAAAPDPVPDEDVGPAPSPGPTGETTAPPTPPTAPPVTDEFVRALYPRLARLFKADLRLERERAGRLIDTRL